MKSKSVLFAIRSQKLLLETFFPVCFTKFLWASAILFFFTQTEKVVIKDTTISKREIFFPLEVIVDTKNFAQRIQLMNKTHEAPPSSTIAGLFLRANVLGATRMNVFPALIFFIRAETIESLSKSTL